MYVAMALLSYIENDLNGQVMRLDELEKKIRRIGQSSTLLGLDCLDVKTVGRRVGRSPAETKTVAQSVLRDAYTWSSEQQKKRINTNQ
jgi:hypothetical protein